MPSVVPTNDSQLMTGQFDDAAANLIRVADHPGGEHAAAGAAVDVHVLFVHVAVGDHPVDAVSSMAASARILTP